jgi:two-component system LytT family response regulator
MGIRTRAKLSSARLIDKKPLAEMIAPKPIQEIDISSLKKTDEIMKALSFNPKITSHPRVVKLSSLKQQQDSLQQKIRHSGKLILPVANGFECIRFQDILYLQAQSNYTEIHTASRKLLFSKTLKFIEELLPTRSFCRVHKSYIVNVAYIRSYVSTAENPHVVLDNDCQIPVSRSHRREFFNSPLLHF